MISRIISVGKAELERIKMFGTVVFACKQTGEQCAMHTRNFIIAENTGYVVMEQGISPYCPNCGSGEYMHNDDENENSYCGQCGAKLIWPERSEDNERSI